MSPNTNHLPTESPDHSASQPDDLNRTGLDDQEEPARNTKENQTPQEQTDDLSPSVTMQDRTNLPPTQPSARSTQTRSNKAQENDNTTNPPSPSQPPNPNATSPTPTPPSQLRTLIFIHLLTGRLHRHLAIIHNLLYNDPARLQPLLENPPAKLSEYGKEILRSKRRKRPESSDRRGRAHAPIARRRRRESSSFGSDGEGSGGDSGSESESAAGREDEGGGGEVEGIGGWWDEVDGEEEFLVKVLVGCWFLVAVAIMVKVCCWSCGWLLNR